MQGKKIVLFVAIAFLAGLLGSWAGPSFFGKTSLNAGNAPVKESTYDRVMRTQTIRCGYLVWPPLTFKDLSNGKLSGMVPNYVEALGEALHLKIEWVEEISASDMTAALESGRIDAECAGIWPTASRALRVDFTIPAFYQAQYVYVRADDMRFDNNIETLNDPSITFSTMDGAMSSIIAAKDFPKAKTVQLPQLTPPGETLTNVVNKKADAAVLDPGTAAQFDANNPGKIRRVVAKAPIRVFGNTLAIPRGQDEFRRMLDTATQELLSSGQIEKIIANYEKQHGIILRAAPTYQNNNTGP